MNYHIEAQLFMTVEALSAKDAQRIVRERLSRVDGVQAHCVQEGRAFDHAVKAGNAIVDAICDKDTP